MLITYFSYVSHYVSKHAKSYFIVLHLFSVKLYRKSGKCTAPIPGGSTLYQTMMTEAIHFIQ
jgi:hypothetical protein